MNLELSQACEHEANHGQIDYGFAGLGLVKENNRIKGLILGAGGDIVLGQSGEKMFQLLFT